MTFKFKIVLGDWSADGHRETETQIIECSHDVTTLQHAYKASCKKLGISFNNNDDFTGLDRDYIDAIKYQICTEYEDDSISPEAKTILMKFGCPLQEIVQDTFTDDKDEPVTLEIDEFVRLLMWFISQSIEEEVKWERVNDEIPVLNGYYNENLNVQFGYGLFQ